MKSILALIAWHGSGAVVKAKRDFQQLYPDGIPFTRIGGAPSILTITPAYKHVGTTTTISGTFAPDIKVRMGSLRGVSRSIRSRLLRHNDIDIKTRATVLRALLLSKALFQCGAWPELPVGERKRVHSAVMRVYRSLLLREQLNDPVWRSDQKVIDDFALTAP